MLYNGAMSILFEAQGWCFFCFIHKVEIGLFKCLGAFNNDNPAIGEDK